MSVKNLEKIKKLSDALVLNHKAMDEAETIKLIDTMSIDELLEAFEYCLEKK